MKKVTLSAQEFTEILKYLNEIRESLKSHEEHVRLSEPYMDSVDACKLLRVSKRTLSTYIASGKLGYSKIRSRHYFTALDIEKFLQDHHVNPTCEK
ncbi:MAG TPA: helix-turn-helix domain-containing protein [Chitinophagales bacterium]|nr:helix-turn-helix domain-containing protein [Chitinophagales bacterium]